MIGKCLSKFLTFSLLSIFITSCGDQIDESKDINNKTLSKMIDNREYHKVLNIIENRVSSSKKNNYLVYKAYALIGLAKLEPIPFLRKVQAPQKFTNKTLKRFYGKCPNKKLDLNIDKLNKCHILRIFNQLPKANNLYLKQALEVLKSLEKQNHLSRQDKVLMLFLSVANIFAQIRDVLIFFPLLGIENISVEDVEKVFMMMKFVKVDLEDISQLYPDYRFILEERFVGSRNVHMFERNLNEGLQFVQESGLDIFFKISDCSIDGPESKNSILRIMDEAYEFFLDFEN